MIFDRLDSEGLQWLVLRYEERKERGMKEYRTQRRCAFLLFTVALIVTVSHAVSKQDGRLSFDTLFPSNAYSRATEQCVKVWGAWDKLISLKSHTSVEVARVLDCSLGQLVLAGAALRTVPVQEKQPLVEQLHYMSRVIGTIADRFIQLPHMDASRYACLKEQISQLRALIEAKMKL